MALGVYSLEIATGNSEFDGFKIRKKGHLPQRHRLQGLGFQGVWEIGLISLWGLYP